MTLKMRQITYIDWLTQNLGVIEVVPKTNHPNPLHQSMGWFQTPMYSSYFSSCNTGLATVVAPARASQREEGSWLGLAGIDEESSHLTMIFSTGHHPVHDTSQFPTENRCPKFQFFPIWLIYNAWFARFAKITLRTFKNMSALLKIRYRVVAADYFPKVTTKTSF